MSTPTEHPTLPYAGDDLSRPESAPPHVPTSAGRRSAYAGSLVVNLVMLWLVNGWPGWEAVPFLTQSAVLVIGAVNAAIIVRALADLVNLVVDLPRVRALGDIVSIAFGLVAVVRWWQVFPFDFTGTAWETVARVVLAIGIVGSVVGIIEACVRLVNGRFPRSGRTS